MTKYVVIVVSLLVIAAGGASWYFFSNNSSQNPQDSMMVQESKVMTSDKMMPKGEATGEGMVKDRSRYVDYSKQAFDAAGDKKRVYFFHAKWCPECKAANLAFNQNYDLIPEDVVIFKTDYDTETALKKQYGITYQHTYVWVDDTGKEIKKWTGGDIEEILEFVN